MESTHTNPATRFPSDWAILTFVVGVLLLSATALLTLKYVFQAIKITALLTIIFATYIGGIDYVLAKLE